MITRITSLTAHNIIVYISTSHRIVSDTGVRGCFLLFQPEQFRQRGGQQQMATGGWGAPMATSTQMGGGGSFYSGSRQDSSMTPLQQHVLNVISSCPQDQGINVKEVVDTMKKHGHGDITVK